MAKVSPGLSVETRPTILIGAQDGDREEVRMVHPSVVDILYEPRDTFARALFGKSGATRFWTLNRMPAYLFCMWVVWSTGVVAILMGSFKEDFVLPRALGALCLPVTLNAMLLFNREIVLHIVRSFDTLFMIFNALATFVCAVTLAKNHLSMASGWFGYLLCTTTPLFFDAMPSKLRARSQMFVPFGVAINLGLLVAFAFDLTSFETDKRFVHFGSNNQLDLKSRLTSFHTVTLYNLRNFAAWAWNPNRLVALKFTLLTSKMTSAEAAALIHQAKWREQGRKALSKYSEGGDMRAGKEERILHSITSSQVPFVVVSDDTLAAFIGLPSLAVWALAVLHHPIIGRALVVAQLAGLALYPAATLSRSPGGFLPGVLFLLLPLPLHLVCVINRDILRRLAHQFETGFVIGNSVLLFAFVCIISKDPKQIAAFGGVVLTVCFAVIGDAVPASLVPKKAYTNAAVTAVLIFFSLGNYGQYLAAFEHVTIEIIHDLAHFNVQDAAAGCAFTLGIFCMKATFFNFTQPNRMLVLMVKTQFRSIRATHEAPGFEEPASSHEAPGTGVPASPEAPSTH